MSCSGCQYSGASTAREDRFVGVRFAEETNLTLCAPNGVELEIKDPVVVRLDEGLAVGRVEKVPMPVFKPCQKASARPIARRASSADLAAWDEQRSKGRRGAAFVKERAKGLRLDMKVTRVDFDFDGKKARCYFTAARRVDFRQLIRDFSQRFRTPVEMIQVGARDEAGLLGGLGICGRTLCCSTWLDDLKPISIQMAKRQNLSLNPSKISGPCGRLLCCLAYEDRPQERDNA